MWISLQGAQAVGKTTLFEYVKENLPRHWWTVSKVSVATLRDDPPQSLLDKLNNAMLELWSTGKTQKHINNAMTELPESHVILTDGCPIQCKDFQSNEMKRFAQLQFREPDYYVKMVLPKPGDNMYRCFSSTDTEYRKKVFGEKLDKEISSRDIEESGKISNPADTHVIHLPVTPDETPAHILERLIEKVEYVQKLQKFVDDLFSNASCAGMSFSILFHKEHLI